MSSEKDNKQTLGGCLSALAMMPVGALFAGFVITRLWGWFLVPMGFPMVTIWQAIGIDLLVTFMATPAPKEGDKFGSPAYCWTMVLVRPAIILGLGWCAFALGSA